MPQKIQSVTISKAPITAVLLVEFAATNYNFMYDALNSSYVFASQLQPQDWVAIVEFDMKTHILVDFTQDKQAIFGALNSLRVPGFRKPTSSMRCTTRWTGSTAFPATRNWSWSPAGATPSARSLSIQTLKKIKATPNVTIYTICTGEAFLERLDAMGGLETQ